MCFLRIEIKTLKPTNKIRLPVEYYYCVTIILCKKNISIVGFIPDSNYFTFVRNCTARVGFGRFVSTNLIISKKSFYVICVNTKNYHVLQTEIVTMLCSRRVHIAQSAGLGI